MSDTSTRFRIRTPSSSKRSSRMASSSTATRTVQSDTLRRGIRRGILYNTLPRLGPDGALLAMAGISKSASVRASSRSMKLALICASRRA